MATKKTKPTLDTNTETKIKNAARIVFHKKGFAATRTRDIAEEAGINLALLNYYFRSKEKLFDMIMMETMHGFMSVMVGVFNDEQTSLEKKIELMVNAYIDTMLEEPEIPLFIMNSIRSQPEGILKKVPIAKMVMESKFMVQYKEAAEQGKVTPYNPLHFISNILGLTLFPFIASPMFKALGKLDDKKFRAMMNERKALIPQWVQLIMQTK